MSITQITERELQLTHYLAETTKALELMRQERDRLDTNLKSWLRANGPEGWIDDLRIEADKLAAENKVLRDTLNNCEDALRNSQTVLGQPSSGFVRVCVDANDLALGIANAALQGRKA